MTLDSILLKDDQWDLLVNLLADPVPGLSAVEVSSSSELTEVIQYSESALRQGKIPYHDIWIDTSKAIPADLAKDIGHLSGLHKPECGVLLVCDRTETFMASLRFWRDMNFMREALGQIESHVIFLLFPENFHLLLTASEHLADWITVKIFLKSRPSEPTRSPESFHVAMGSAKAVRQLKLLEKQYADSINTKLTPLARTNRYVWPIFKLAVEIHDLQRAGQSYQEILELGQSEKLHGFKKVERDFRRLRDMDESTLLASIVTALGAYVAEDAKVFADKVGHKAYAKCKTLALTMFDRLRGNPKHDMILDEFQKEPDVWQGPLKKMLEKACEQNVELREEFGGLFEAYDQEKQAFTATVHGDHGLVAQGENIKQAPNGIAADNIKTGGGDVVVGTKIVHMHAGPDSPIKGGAEAEDQSSLNKAEEAYRRWVVDKYQYLQFRGFGLTDKLPLRLKLQDLYVSGKARIELPEGERGCEGLELAGRKMDRLHEAQARLSNESVVLEDLIKKHDGMVILGDPGAGKTTFLKRLSLGMAQSPNAPLPLLLPLSEYARALENQSKRIPLTEFVLEYLAGCVGMSRLPIAEMIQACLDQDKAFILLDGLDEVRDGALRDYVMDQVVNFYCLYKGRCRFVMTSRIIGYKAVRRVIEGLRECTLVDFDDEDIASFVDKWTQVVEEHVLGQGDNARERAEQERSELMHSVGDHKGVRRLAGNPLLLTILAMMKRQGVVLPRRRAQLYDKYMETLITSWNRVRGLGRRFSGELELNPTLEVLAPLAFLMHEKSAGVGLVSEEHLMDMLTRIQKNRGRPNPREEALRFFNDFRSYSGILMERGLGQYGFMHLTIEEYLAAIDLANQINTSDEAVSNLVIEHIDQQPWYEVSLLAIGYLALKATALKPFATKVVVNLLENQSGSRGKTAVLAGQAVFEVGEDGFSSDTVEKTCQRLLGIMADSEIDPSVRCNAGDVLARLGDLRKEVLDSTCMEFRKIEAGPFWYGEGEEGHECKELDYQYRLARYPVTVAQFRQFSEAGGYQGETYWQEAEDAGCWKSGRFKARYGYGEAWRKGLAELPDRFCLANHPMVIVSWYESMAYCRWLTDQWLASKIASENLSHLNPKEWIFTLPSEKQWEKAARGPAPRKRPYPCGDELTPNLANHRKTHIESTSAVGCFPKDKSPYNCMDMTGNVWEWCHNKHSEDSSFRVFRGGSWFESAQFCLCSSRDWGVPDFRRDVLGFRVALVPSSVG